MTPQEYWQQLDLNYICNYMCSDAYMLPRWDLADAQECMQLYKRFLWLMMQHGPAGIVPTKEIDEFWHNHILHSKRYVADCKALVGHYIHHQPSDGSAEDIAKLQQLFERTCQLYKKEFGSELPVYIED